MGINLHILDRRAVQLDIGGVPYEVGTVRSAGKLTEGPTAEPTSNTPATPGPVAVLVAEPTELPLASGQVTGAHVVLGWDEDRHSVTDLGWDHLPVLGYGVRDPGGDIYLLHELIGGALQPMTQVRARSTGLLDETGLVRQGQPTIVACNSVQRFPAAGFAEADCVLSDGRRDRIVLRISSDTLPDPAWLIGRRPVDAALYPRQGSPASRRQP